MSQNESKLAFEAKNKNTVPITCKITMRVNVIAAVKEVRTAEMTDSIVIYRAMTAPSGKGIIDENYCNSKTKVFRDDYQTVFIFRYNKISLDTFQMGVELQNLKDTKRWDLVQHPFLLNIIDQVMLKCVFLSIAHIGAYYLIMLFLYVVFYQNFVVIDTCTTVGVILALSVFLISMSVINRCMKCLDCKRHMKANAKDSEPPSEGRLESRRRPRANKRPASGPCTKTMRCAVRWGSAAVLGLFIFLAMWRFLPARNLVCTSSPLPIQRVVILSGMMTAWWRCLKALYMSPSGKYVVMLREIAKSFVKTSVIFVPTLMCFSFSFQLLTQYSGEPPWDNTNRTNPQKKQFQDNLIQMLQMATKTSAMMVGEITTKDVLALNSWLLNCVFVFFVIFTVIILMNLVVSIAVGDVNELRRTSERVLIKYRTTFVINILTFLCPWFDCCGYIDFKKFNNCLQITRCNGVVRSCYVKFDWNEFTFENNAPKTFHVFMQGNVAFENNQDLSEGSFLVKMVKPGVDPLPCLPLPLEVPENALEGPEEGLETAVEGDDSEKYFPPEKLGLRLKRWFVGVNWMNVAYPDSPTMQYVVPGRRPHLATAHYRNNILHDIANH